MTRIKKIIAIGLLLLFSLPGIAQEKVEMADTMRSNGRIYVVVAVVVTILLGLILYLVRLDRKMSRMERDNRQ